MKKIRLDRYLTAHHPHFSRSYVKKLIEEGFVLVDGERKKPSHLLRGPERIEIKRRVPEIPEATPEPIPLDILYEDDSLLVLNKPSGLVVHPAPGNPTGTLLNALLYHTPWVGLVHRLDKGTSGVMVTAKTEEAQKNLSLQFKKRRVAKVYWALAMGKFPVKEGRINRPMGRDTTHRRKFSSHSKKLREASTSFRVLKEYPGLTFLELRPETGRTHQIRVHLSEERHPIAGDTVYGAKGFLAGLKEEPVHRMVERLAHPALHAAELSFQHPAAGRPVSFKAPLPADLKEILTALDSL